MEQFAVASFDIYLPHPKYMFQWFRCSYQTSLAFSFSLVFCFWGNLPSIFCSSSDYCSAGYSTFIAVVKCVSNPHDNLFFCEPVISASCHVCNIKVCAILQKETEIGWNRIFGKLLLATQHKGLVYTGKAYKVIQRVFWITEEHLPDLSVIP